MLKVKEIASSMQWFLQNKPYEIRRECVDLPISNLGLKWVAWAIILVYTYKQMNEHTYILTYNSLFVYMHTYRQTDIHLFHLRAHAIRTVEEKLHWNYAVMRSKTDEKGGESVGNPWGIVGNRISNRGIRVSELNFSVCFMGFLRSRFWGELAFYNFKEGKLDCPRTPGLCCW